MFFEQVVLQRKGPLGTVWLACHYEKKLTKTQVTDTNIAETTDKIKNPKAAMALRLSGHLLLGIVRIYCKKVDYLYTDSSEALVKIKMSFRPGVVDMEQSVVNANAITMPENFGDFELLLPGGIDADLLPNAEEGLFTLNIAKAVTITMPTYGSIGQGSSGSLGTLFNEEKHPEIEEMRKKSTSGESGDNLGQLSKDQSATHEDLLDPSKYVQEPINEMGEKLDIQGAYDPNQLEDPGQLWQQDISPETDKETSSSTDKTKGLEIKGIDVPDLLTTTSRIRTQKRFVVDKRTQLSQAVMEKTITDPSSLLRRLARSPPTKGLIDREFLNYTDTLYNIQSNNLRYSPALDRLLKRGMKSKAQDVPEGTKRISPTETMMQDSVSIETTSTSEDTKKRKKRLSKGDMDVFEPQYSMGDDFGAITYDQQTINEPVQDFTSGSIFAQSKAQQTIVTKRTKNMHTFMQKNFAANEAKNQDHIKFNELFAQKKRRTVAIAFFEILGLKSKGCIDVQQKTPYGNISIYKTANFNEGMDFVDPTMQSQTI